MYKTAKIIVHDVIAEVPEDYDASGDESIQEMTKSVKTNKGNDVSRVSSNTTSSSSSMKSSASYDDDDEWECDICGSMNCSLSWLCDNCGN